MNNILKISAIASLAFVTCNSQAAELVKVQKIDATELLEITKLHLAQSIKLNTLVINPIEKAAYAQVAMKREHSGKDVENTIKTITFAE